MVKIPKKSVAVWLPSAFSDRSHFYSLRFNCFTSLGICGASTLQCSNNDFVCLIVIRIACLKDGEFQLGRPQI